MLLEIFVWEARERDADSLSLLATAGNLGRWAFRRTGCTNGVLQRPAVSSSCIQLLSSETIGSRCYALQNLQVLNLKSAFDIKKDPISLTKMS